MFVVKMCLDMQICLKHNQNTFWKLRIARNYIVVVFLIPFFSRLPTGKFCDKKVNLQQGDVSLDYRLLNKE